MPDRIAIVAGVRTPFCKAWTNYRHLTEAQLARTVITELTNRLEVDPTMIDLCTLGCVSVPMDGPNVAREAILRSPLPNNIPAYTTQYYCASSGVAVINACGDILMGNADIAIAGGVESMSAVRARLSLPLTHALNDASRAKTLPKRLKAFGSVKGRDLKPVSPSISEPTTGKSMGESAEDMAKEYGISREEQDRFAEASHHRAAQAYEAHRFPEVMTVLTGESYEDVIQRDNGVRPDTNVEKMAKLSPVFDRAHGSVTAANASPLTDGASAVILMKEERARDLGYEPLAFIRSQSIVALDLTKHAMLLGPSLAMPLALKRAGLQLEDVDLFELHEAFAAQVLANLKVLDSQRLSKQLGLDQALGSIDRDRLNVNGGSIALGHPFGATGTRIITQLAGEMQRRDKNLGLIGICAAGGLGFGMVLER